MVPMHTPIGAPLAVESDRRFVSYADIALFHTPGAELFDGLTRLASHICQTPIAVIGLVDGKRHWIESSWGLERTAQMSSDAALCTYTTTSRDMVLIHDASADDRFAHNPLVRGYPYARFFAGVPLLVAGDDSLGALCVVDRQPRTLTSEQCGILKSIAGMAVAGLLQRRRMTRLLDRSGVEIYEIDARSGEVLRISASAVRATGYTPAELCGLTLSQLLPGMFLPGGFADYVVALQAAAESSPPAVRTMLRRKDGTDYLVDVVLELSLPVTMNRVLALSVAVNGRPVDRNATVSPPLELQNERLHILTSVARNLFDALDPPALVEALVGGVRKMTGGGSVELTARKPGGQFAKTSDLTSVANAPSIDDDFLLAATLEGVKLDQDGLRAAVPVLAPSGELAFVLDIRGPTRPFGPTDVYAFALLGQYVAVAIRNVEISRELTSRRAAIVELNGVKDDLIAMLAHDFKGPLTTIVGLADVLAEDERFDAESRRLLGLIHSTAMRLASLASDTLALSRLEQTEYALRFLPVDLVGLVRDVVRVLGVTRTIDFRSSVAETIVRTDAAHVRQAFENIIGNAIKYSPGGETVTVTLREKRDGVEVAIRDRGIGIPAADVPRLFGRFARGANARKLGIGGTGFGLYLSRTIVERHGGHIAIESKEGAGSTVRVFIPRGPVGYAAQDRRILLLDSDDDANSSAAQTLRDCGYIVFAVADEAALLQELADARYDAAVVDTDRLFMSPAQLVERIAGRTTLVRLIGAAEPIVPGAAAVVRKAFLVTDLQTVVDSAVMERRHGARRRGARRREISG